MRVITTEGCGVQTGRSSDGTVTVMLDSGRILAIPADQVAEETANVPAATVIVPTPEVVAALRSSTLLIAYKTAARHNGTMQLTRAFRATVAKFNKEYGQSCRTWADVRAVMIAAGIKGVKP